MAETGLMLLEQAPIIREKLESLKAEIESEVSEALSLVCTEDTVKAVKDKRAELNKRLQILEEQRKAIKKGVLEPYEAFEAVYKECVSDTLKQADVALKSKIDDVENEIKRRCENELRAYFAELCIANAITWLRFEQCGIKIGLAEAKQKTFGKLKTAINDFVERVHSDVMAIAAMDNREEIMVEYKQSLSLSQSIQAVELRHTQMVAERIANETFDEAMKQSIEAAAKVEEVAAVAPPKEVTSLAEATKTYTATFTVKTTLDKLKLLKVFLNENGIEFK